MAAKRLEAVIAQYQCQVANQQRRIEEVGGARSGNRLLASGDVILAVVQGCVLLSCW